MNLPKEILAYILVFLDFNYEKKVIYLPDTKKRKKFVDKVYYIPTDECLINKYWHDCILYYKCKVCPLGKYNIYSKLCMTCGHIMESNLKRHRRCIKN